VKIQELEESMAHTDEIIREVESAYHHYIEVFNRGDAAGFVGCYSHPHAMLSSEQGMVVINTETDHHRIYQGIKTTLEKNDWGRSEIDRLQIWPFSKSLAQLVADVTRYKKDGSILEQLRATYMFRSENGAWKIISLSLIEAPFSGPGVNR
jgi:ketosteroid isomerase-like protein